MLSFAFGCAGSLLLHRPLQCSCLENPRDGGAWWAAVSGVAQSRTRLKRLGSSSSSSSFLSSCGGLLSGCGSQASRGSGFSGCRAQILEPGGCRSCSAWAQQLWRARSRAQATLVLAPRLSRSSACGYFPDQGPNPHPLLWQVDSYPLYHQGSPTLM